MPRPPAPEYKPASTGPSMGLIGTVVALIVALIAGLVWWATRGDGLGAEGTTSTLADGGGVSVGPGADAKVPQVQLYEDFQCPWCGHLEKKVGPELARKAEAGEINVTYTIMSFLDQVDKNQSSTRAANAALCADEQGKFSAFHEKAYAAQPEEGVGYTDAQFTDFAKAAGLSGDTLASFEKCVQTKPHAAYVKDMQERANQDGVTSTPTLKINGKKVDDQQMSGLIDGTMSLDEVLRANS